MKILVTGANGQLGSELNFLATNQEDWIFCDRQTFDLAKPEVMSAQLALHQPQIVINCAAYTAVDKAEEEVENCFLINRDAVKNLARLCQENKIKLIHISSDYVYHLDQSEPLVESDNKEPKGVYARSKKEGEDALIQSGAAYVILRTSWVYSSFGHNFIKTVIRLAKDRDEMSVVNDQIGAPTYARDLARSIIDLIKLDATEGWNQVYNYANTGQTNWSEIAQFIIDNTEAEMQIKPIPSSEYPTPAQRPKWSVLSTDKFRSSFKLEIRSWQESLLECLKQL